MFWKPTSMDRRLIRAYAARIEKRRPSQIVLYAAERVSNATGSVAFNTYLLDPDPDFGDTDLHDRHPFAGVKSIQTTDDGRALVDFYIFEREWDDYGELLGNAQAHVALDPVTRKPVLWKLTGTMAPAEIVRADIAETQAAYPVGVDG